MEILQNCNIFNDGAFNDVSDKAIKAEHQLILEHGKPLLFGKDRNKGIKMNGMRPEVVTIGENGVSEKDIVVHDESNLSLAFMLGNFEAPMPTPVGVSDAVSRPTYDGAMNKQLTDAKAKQGPGDFGPSRQIAATPGPSTSPRTSRDSTEARRPRASFFFARLAGSLNRDGLEWG